MKKSILSIISVLISGFVFAQSVQIPNSSFENWENSDKKTKDWYSTNDLAASAGVSSFQNVFKYSAVKSAGNYSVQLKTADFSGAKIPGAITNGRIPPLNLSDPKVSVNSIIPAIWDYKENPSSLTVDLHYTHSGSDTGLVIARFFKSHNQIGEGKLELTASTSGTALNSSTITITYTNSAAADSFFIYLASSYSKINASTNFNTGSVLLADKLVFGGISGIRKSSNANFIEFTPNPAKNYLTINAAGLKQNETEISVFNSLGSLIYKEELKGTGAISHTVPMTSMPPGIYFVQLQNGEVTETKRVVKE